MDLKKENIIFAGCKTTRDVDKLTDSNIKKEACDTLIQDYNCKIEVSELSPTEDNNLCDTPKPELDADDAGSMLLR